MTQEECRKLAEKIRNLKPGESLTVACKNQQEAVQVRQELAKQRKRMGEA